MSKTATSHVKHHANIPSLPPKSPSSRPVLHVEHRHVQESRSLGEFEVAESVMHALQELGYRELQDVDVRIRQGSLLLSGTVSSFHLKQVAQNVAHSEVPDLRIRNELRVCWPETKTVRSNPR